jgi:hypothetical protein
MINTKFYVHGSKESNWDMASELGKDTDEQFMENFRFAGYEVEFDVEITDQGEVFATHINGVRISRRVQI